MKDKLGHGPARLEFERCIFDLFQHQKSPEDVFNALVDLIGRRYSLIAYIFYVFDSDQFLPIAPKIFDQAFEKLGVDIRTVKLCSWENYKQFIGAVRSIQTALRDLIGLHDVRLIDAHSYLWLLVRLPLKEPKRKDKMPSGSDDLKDAMITLGQAIVYRTNNANGQRVERTVKPKEWHGFSSQEGFYEFFVRNVEGARRPVQTNRVTNAAS